MLKSQSKAKLYSRRYGTYCFTVDVLYPTVDESKIMFCKILFRCFLFRLFASQWWRTGCPRITGDASLQPHLKPFLWIISLSPSFDAIVETLKNEPVSTPCVFSCQVFSLIKTRVRVHLLHIQMGKGRTTVGLVTACLIKEIQITKELR